MIQIKNKHLDSFALTNRAIIKEAKKRGYTVSAPYLGCPHLFIKISEDKTVHVLSSTPQTTSLPAAELSNDKFATYEVLVEASIPQPETIVVSGNDQNAKDFLGSKSKIVVKPLDASHGDGITIGVANNEDLATAIKKALECSTIQKVILQEQLDASSKDIRLLCINYEFIGAIHRIPARVTGDGRSSLEKLIDIENATTRGKRYSAGLASIDKPMALKFLGKSSQDIPKIGEKVQVVGLANLGQGGEYEDSTDHISPEIIKMAEKIAKIMKLPVIGVDMLGDKVIEVNKCPSLFMHDEPMVGQNRKTVEKYLDYLETI